MPAKKRTYSKFARTALELFGQHICLKRKAKKMTAQELCDRAGISRGLLQRIEQGNPICEIGVAFELATILGIRLFDSDESNINSKLEQVKDKVALLPRPSKRRKDFNDDF